MSDSKKTVLRVMEVAGIGLLVAVIAAAIFLAVFAVAHYFAGLDLVKSSVGNTDSAITKAYIQLQALPPKASIRATGQDIPVEAWPKTWPEYKDMDSQAFSKSWDICVTVSTPDGLKRLFVEDRGGLDGQLLRAVCCHIVKHQVEVQETQKDVEALQRARKLKEESTGEEAFRRYKDLEEMSRQMQAKQTRRAP